MAILLHQKYKYTPGIITVFILSMVIIKHYATLNFQNLLF